jgi:hypothetical protein
VGRIFEYGLFYRPQSKRDIADSKHAFAMRDLKKEINLPDDFTSFSFDVHTSYNFTESDAVYSSFLPKKGVIYWFSILIRDPEYECTHCWYEVQGYKCPRCRIQSDKTLFVSRRGNRTDI